MYPYTIPTEPKMTNDLNRLAPSWSWNAELYENDDYFKRWKVTAERIDPELWVRLCVKREARIEATFYYSVSPEFIIEFTLGLVKEEPNIADR